MIYFVIKNNKNNSKVFLQKKHRTYPLNTIWTTVGIYCKGDKLCSCGCVCKHIHAYTATFLTT
jgi:hypothetical protein